MLTPWAHCKCAGGPARVTLDDEGREILIDEYMLQRNGGFAMTKNTLRYPVLFGGCAVLLMAGAAHAAGDAAKETQTAAVHAGLAAAASDINTIQMHLHHTVNCLVGPKGEGFDTKPGNPCQGQGDGALTDTTNAAGRAKLKRALMTAQAGIKATDASTAQKAAADTLAALK
jgi:hypothetical protein